MRRKITMYDPERKQEQLQELRAHKEPGWDDPESIAANLPTLDPESVIMPDWAPPWEDDRSKQRVSCAISIERITQRIQKAGGAKIDAVLRVRLSDPVEVGDTMTQVEGLVQLLRDCVNVAQMDAYSRKCADSAHAARRRAQDGAERVSIQSVTERATGENRRLDASVKGRAGEVAANLRVIAPADAGSLAAIDELLFEMRQRVRALIKGE